MASTFVVLPSSVRHPIRNNSQNDYETMLAKPLEGENLYVRLSSISFNKSWFEVHSENNAFYTGILPDPAIIDPLFTGHYLSVKKNSMEMTESFDINGQSVKMLNGKFNNDSGWMVPLASYKIPEGTYESEEDIIKIMKEKNPFDYAIKMLNNPRRIYINVSPGCVLVLPSKGLGSVLGFKEKSDFLSTGDYESKFPLYSLSRIPYFHVVLEGLTRPVHYGSGQAPVLETIPGDGQTDQVLEYIYKNNPFHEVINHHINLIRVQLLDRNFRPVPVTGGETIVTLEFKHGQL